MSTPCTRSQPTTLRGSSPSTQPIARSGNASTVNRNATLTRSCTLTAPALSRNAPTSRTTSVPRFGSASISGSKNPRTRPTCTNASRSSCALPPNRAVSADSRPSVLTTSAPSKLSCASADSSARSCCALVIRGDIRREYATFSVKTAGNTSSPIRASTQSVKKSAVAATTTMKTTPTANGNGAIGYQTASTSLFALDSREPVGCRWCQESGSSRYLRVTRRR